MHRSLRVCLCLLLVAAGCQQKADLETSLESALRSGEVSDSASKFTRQFVAVAREVLDPELPWKVRFVTEAAKREDGTSYRGHIEVRYPVRLRVDPAGVFTELVLMNDEGREEAALVLGRVTDGNVKPIGRDIARRSIGLREDFEALVSVYETADGWQAASSVRDLIWRGTDIAAIRLEELGNEELALVIESPKYEVVISWGDGATIIDARKVGE